jgi:hypothetical protein
MHKQSRTLHARIVCENRQTALPWLIPNLIMPYYCCCVVRTWVAYADFQSHIQIPHKSPKWCLTTVSPPRAKKPTKEEHQKLVQTHVGALIKMGLFHGWLRADWPHCSHFLFYCSMQNPNLGLWGRAFVNSLRACCATCVNWSSLRVLTASTTGDPFACSGEQRGCGPGCKVGRPPVGVVEWAASLELQALVPWALLEPTCSATVIHLSQSIACAYEFLVVHLTIHTLSLA